MKFGAFVPQGWRITLAGIPTEAHWSTMNGVAQDIERLGFDSLWVYDHFHTWPMPTQEVTYEAWTLMSALAASTETVRLGQMCTCNTYRPPAYLAKVAASIDVISGGRLEMGIGAGWYEHEHDGYGYEFKSPGGRLGMLREGVEIMKALWTEEAVDYEGTHYQLKGAISQPKPVQSPHIPIWVAGGGEKVTLKIAATHAQYTNFGTDSVDTFNHKSVILKDHCETAGTDFDAITRSTNFNIMMGDSHHEVQEKLDWLRTHMRTYVPDNDKADRFTAGFEQHSGTPDEVIARLKAYEEAGMEYAIVNFADVAYERSSIEMFAEQVIPAFR